MRRQCLFAAVCALAGACGLPGRAQAGVQATGQAALEALAAQIEVEARAWLAGGDESGEAAWKLKAVTYDTESVAVLASLLSKPREDTVDLYVSNHLLRPLLLAKTEVIRKALPVVKDLHGRLAKYRKLPKYSDEQLKAYAEPRKVPGMGPRALAAIVAEVQRRRDEKLAKDRRVKLHNEQVTLLKRNYYRLVMIAADPQADADLLAMLEKAEEDGLWLYAEIVDAIRAETGKMRLSRAERFYAAMKDLWVALRDEKPRTYIDPGTVTLRATANSTVAEHRDAPGKRLLKVINLLATAARKPALIHPKDKKSSGRRKPGRGGRRRI